MTTSSPGSNPARLERGDHAHPRSRRSTCASASSFSRSWRAISRSTAAPLTRYSPAPTRSTSNAAPGRRAEHAELGHLALAGRDASRHRLGAPGTRRSSSRASSSRPVPRRARGDEHRHVAAETPAPRVRGRLGRLRRDEVRLREREDPRQRGEPGIVLGELALDHLVVGLRIGAVERREVEHVDEQPRALDVREEVVAEAGAVAGALDQPGDVGDHELAVVGLERPEHRLERRERVVGDLRVARASGARAATTCRRSAARRGRRRRAA